MTLIITVGRPDEHGGTGADAKLEVSPERSMRRNLITPERRASSAAAPVNIARLLQPGKPVVLITGNAHIYRAVRTGKSFGTGRIRKLPAPSEPSVYGFNMILETVQAFMRAGMKQNLSQTLN